MQAAHFPCHGYHHLAAPPHPRRGRRIIVARSLFANWEETLSRFRPDSELSLLNRHCGQAGAVSPLLYEVAWSSAGGGAPTDGLFDFLPCTARSPTSGYDRSFDSLPAQVAVHSAALGPAGGWRTSGSDPDERR